jgi:hypothetical protein
MSKVRWGTDHHYWKGDGARDDVKHARARRLYRVLGSCERCGGKATERHHKDDDAGNNARSNIAFLCRRCHMAEDGRLDALRIAGRREPDPPRACENCTRLYKPLRKGRCWPCYSYLQRHGQERAPIPTRLKP